MIEFNYTVRTVLRKHTNSSTVSFVIRWNRKKQELWLSTGVQWTPEKWDQNKQQARNNTSFTSASGKTIYAREINAMRLFYLECIEKAFKIFKEHDTIPSVDDLKEQINEFVANVYKIQKNDSIDFMDTHEYFQIIYEKYMRERAVEKNWRKSTRDKNTQMWKCLCAYKKNITLGGLNRRTLNGLKQWYFDNGYHNTTVAKRFRDLKSFLRWVASNGYPVNEEALTFESNVPRSEKVITYLTSEELEHLAKYPFKQQYLSNARDIFCFMCYTSLRYSDVRDLKKANISGRFINLFTRKTKSKLEIPIVKQAQEILDRNITASRETVFKVPSNQKLNDYIKVIAKEAKLNRRVEEMYYVGNNPHETFKPIHEIISCHMARRTFVTCSLALGISPEVVMACTGHSTYEAMKPYIAIASSTKKTQMEKWNDNPTKRSINSKIDQLTPSQIEKLDKYLTRLLNNTK